eukprot:ANDGO_07562.mRNA.1 Spindle pole body component 97
MLSRYASQRDLKLRALLESLILGMGVQDDGQIATLFDYAYKSITEHTFLTPSRASVEKRYVGMIDRFELDSKLEIASRLQRAMNHVLRTDIGNPMDGVNASILLVLLEVSYKPLEKSAEEMSEFFESFDDMLKQRYLDSVASLDRFENAAVVPIHELPAFIRDELSAKDGDLGEWALDFDHDSQEGEEGDFESNEMGSTDTASDGESVSTTEPIRNFPAEKSAIQESNQDTLFASFLGTFGQERPSFFSQPLDDLMLREVVSTSSVPTEQLFTNASDSRVYEHVRVVQPKELIRECCGVLRGADVEFAEWHADLGIYRYVPHRIVVANATPGITGSFIAEVLRAASFLRSSLQTVSQLAGWSAAGFAYHVESRRHELFAALSDFEKDFMVKLPSILRLRTFAEEISLEWSVYHSICQRHVTAGSRSADILSSIFDHVQDLERQGAADLLYRGDMYGMLNLAFAPFVQLVETWVFEGFLHDPFEEFFVRNDESSGFVLAPDKVPIFIPSKMAGSIYEAGLNVLLLQHIRTSWKESGEEDGDADADATDTETSSGAPPSKHAVSSMQTPPRPLWKKNFAESSLTSLRSTAKRQNSQPRIVYSPVSAASPKSPSYGVAARTSRLVDHLHEDLADRVNLQVSFLSSSFSTLIKDRCHVLIHLATLRAVYFMEQGDLCYEFYSRLFSTSGMLLSSTITGFFVESVDTCGYLHREYLDRFRVNISMENDQSSITASTTATSLGISDTRRHKNGFSTLDAIDCLSFSYDVPYPISSLLDRDCVSHYQSVFRFLLQIHHARHLCREKSMESVSGSFGALMLRFSMIQFLDALLYYLMSEAIGITWADLSDKIDKARDLQQLVEIHRTYVRGAANRCLVTPQMRVVWNQVSKILQLIREFSFGLQTVPVIRDRFSAAVDVLITIITKMVATGNATFLSPFLMRINFNMFYRSGE